MIRIKVGRFQIRAPFISSKNEPLLFSATLLKSFIEPQNPVLSFVLELLYHSSLFV
jgi:hypothetical protein